MARPWLAQGSLDCMRNTLLQTDRIGRKILKRECSAVSLATSQPHRRRTRPRQLSHGSSQAPPGFRLGALAAPYGHPTDTARHGQQVFFFQPVSYTHGTLPQTHTYLAACKTHLTFHVCCIHTSPGRRAARRGPAFAQTARRRILSVWRSAIFPGVRSARGCVRSANQRKSEIS